ncbi:MAG: hypothetical protein WA192_05450 [Candidatus Acidiferrales bacterium]
MLIQKIAYTLGVAVAILFIAIAGAFWWAGTPPRHPSNVPSTAAYFPGLALGLPAPKHGAWVSCWYDAGQSVDRCRIFSVDGVVIYEGVFVPYKGQVAVPQGDLLIDSQVMAKAQEQVEVNAAAPNSTVKLWAFVPLVFLRNGQILIPAQSYESGKRRLDDLRNAGSPYVPAK